MSENKKYILNSTGSDLSESLVSLLSELEIEVLTEVADNASAIIFEVINSIDNSSNNYQQIYIGEVEKISEFIANSGKAILSEDVLTSKIGSLIFKRLLGDKSSLDFTVAFDGGLKAAQAFKVSDFFSSGYYSDLLSKEAAKEQFDALKIKNYFNFLCSYFSILGQESVASLPVEVDYGSSEDFFVVQAHVGIDGINPKMVTDAFGEFDPKNPFQSLLSLSSLNCDVLDCYILGKGERLVITALWSKESFAHRSIFINNIDSFPLTKEIPSLKVETAAAPTESDSDDVELPKVETANSIEEIVSETKTQEQKEDEASSSSTELNYEVNHKRLAEFVKKKRDEDSDQKDLNDLVSTDVLNYLQDYPAQGMVEKLGENDIDQILKILREPKLIEAVENQVKEFYKEEESESVFDKIVHSIEELTVEDADEIVSAGLGEKDIHRVKGWLESDDDASVVSGSKDDLGEENFRVQGSKEDLTEESFRVQGNREDLAEETFVVSGGGGEQADDKWKVKKQEVLSEVANLKDQVDSGELAQEQVYEKVKSLLADKFSVGEEASDKLASGILDDAANEYVQKEMGETVPKADHIKLRLEHEKAEGQLAKANDQVVRMKRVLDGMKAQLIATKNTADLAKEQAAAAAGPGQGVMVTKLMQEVDKANKKIEMHDKAVQVVKDGHRVVVQKKDDQIKDLEKKLYKLKEENSESSKVVISRLETEKDKLEASLKTTEKRFEVVNQKLEDQIKSSNEETEKITQAMDAKMKLAADALQKFKEEKQELTDELAKLKDELKPDKDTVIEPDNLMNPDADATSDDDLNEDLLAERDSIIDELSDQLQDADNKLKDSELNVKKLEQKLKFLTVQVEEAKKAAAKATKGSKGGMNDSGSAKTKQLEKMIEKLNQVNSKVNKELSDKKIESLNMKKENTTLQNKVAQLEKIIAKLGGSKAA